VMPENRHQKNVEKIRPDLNFISRNLSF